MAGYRSKAILLMEEIKYTLRVADIHQSSKEELTDIIQKLRDDRLTLRQYRSNLPTTDDEHTQLINDINDFIPSIKKFIIPASNHLRLLSQTSNTIELNSIEKNVKQTLDKIERVVSKLNETLTRDLSSLNGSQILTVKSEAPKLYPEINAMWEQLLNLPTNVNTSLLQHMENVNKKCLELYELERVYQTKLAVINKTKPSPLSSSIPESTISSVILEQNQQQTIKPLYDIVTPTELPPVDIIPITPDEFINTCPSIASRQIQISKHPVESTQAIVTSDLASNENASIHCNESSNTVSSIVSKDKEISRQPMEVSNYIVTSINTQSDEVIPERDLHQIEY